ncbi:MAG TPA: phosphoenolpyruvate--protein phosphotransferase [Dongiaceae bacterium]|nr:phosphoenolpyruvate--protein phosphotransferase [Dongiaceae bacterium]
MKVLRNVVNLREERIASFELRGTPISPGYAQGLVHKQHDLISGMDDFRVDSLVNAEEELGRLDRATAKISIDLLALAARVDREIDSRLAEVFGAHNLILNDHVLRQELKTEIAENLVTAGSAVKSVFQRWERRFLLMESAIAKEKGDDIRDLSIRLRSALSGITAHPLESIPENCILVTQRLLPSDTIYLNARSTAAVLLEYGTMGSHAALFARQMGIPCISGIRDIQNQLTTGMLVLVDAFEGEVSVNPSQKVVARFHKLAKQNSSTLMIAKARAAEPAITQDNVSIKVNANVGSSEDSYKAVESGADGVGLYRLEQFYIGRLLPPSCDEIRDEMRHTLAPFSGKSVCIRLLDLGSDKQLPFIGFMSESNPALGRRGIRLMRRYPELLNTQIRAILQLMNEFDVQILVPMVTTADDMRFVREVLEGECYQAQLLPPPLGAMIETPAAALAAKSIAAYSDFMSFGTNDLTQYTFAADRENAEVGDYYNDTSDVIFRLLSLVHADIPTMPLSICGELASRAKFIPRLLQCGIGALSVAPPLIPAIKETIRHIKVLAPYEK